MYFADFYPGLAPSAYEAEIRRLLGELHSINFYSLTFTGKPEGTLAAKKNLNERLKENISDRYRAAIEHKLKRQVDRTER